MNSTVRAKDENGSATERKGCGLLKTTGLTLGLIFLMIGTETSLETPHASVSQTRKRVTRLHVLATRRMHACTYRPLYYAPAPIGLTFVTFPHISSSDTKSASTLSEFLPIYQLSTLAGSVFTMDSQTLVVTDSRLRALAPELLCTIFDSLNDESLPILRLTSKTLELVSFDRFAKAFFSHRTCYIFAKTGGCYFHDS